MTEITDEMREAGEAALRNVMYRGDVPTWAEFEKDYAGGAKAAYLAMRALDPEVAETQRYLGQVKELWAVSAKAAANAYDFLASQGYTRAEDGTWDTPEQPAGALGQSTRLFSDTVAQRAAVDPAFRGALADLDRIEALEAELAALRPVVEAARAYNDWMDAAAYCRLREAVQKCETG